MGSLLLNASPSVSKSPSGRKITEHTLTEGRRPHLTGVFVAHHNIQQLRFVVRAGPNEMHQTALNIFDLLHAITLKANIMLYLTMSQTGL